jgi:hypothetical protein
MRHNVKLDCLTGWMYTLWFIGNAKEYRLWRQSDEDPRRVLIQRAPGPLTWRRIAADLRTVEDIGLAGDLLSDIGITGVEPWQADVLKLAWCVDQGPADSQLEFLLDLPDQAIELLHRRSGNLTDDPVLSALTTLADGLDILPSPPELVTEAIAARMDWRSDPADDVHPDDELDAWARAVCEWLCHHQPAGPSLDQVAACNTPADLLALSNTAPRPDHPDVACAVLARWLDLVVRAPDREASRDVYGFSSSFFLWVVGRLPDGAVMDGLARREPRERLAVAAVVDIASHELARANTGGGLGRQFRVAEASGWRIVLHEIKGPSPVS